jgi:hypothetical protein
LRQIELKKYKLILISFIYEAQLHIVSLLINIPAQNKLWNFSGRNGAIIVDPELLVLLSVVDKNIDLRASLILA